MRIDGEDADAVAGERAPAEADRRLALPRADLDDHAAAFATPRELVQRLALVVRQPPRNAGDQRLDGAREFGHRGDSNGTLFGTSLLVGGTSRFPEPSQAAAARTASS